MTGRDQSVYKSSGSPLSENLPPPTLTIKDIKPILGQSRIIAHRIPFRKEVVNDVLDMSFETEYVFLFPID